MNPKLHEVARRQRALTEKALNGTITPAEREELTRIGKAVEEATAPAPALRVVPMTMTLADFRKHAEAVLSAEAPSADAVALLKRNLEAIRVQGKKIDTDTVAVEMEVAEPAAPADPIAALAARVAALEAGSVGKGTTFDGRTNPGLRVAPAPAPAPAAAAAPAAEGAAAAAPVGKQEPVMPGESSPAAAAVPPAQATPGSPTIGSVFQAMGTEAMDALIARYTETRNRMADGSITREDVERLWENQWPLRDIVNQSIAVLAKADALKAAIEGALPELRKAAETEPAPAAAATPPPPPAAAPPAPEGEPVAKASMDVADMAPPAADPKAQFARLRKAGGRDR